MITLEGTNSILFGIITAVLGIFSLMHILEKRLKNDLQCGLHNIEHDIIQNKKDIDKYSYSQDQDKSMLMSKIISVERENTARYMSKEMCAEIQKRILEGMNSLVDRMDKMEKRSIENEKKTAQMYNKLIDKFSVYSTNMLDRMTKLQDGLQKNITSTIEGYMKVIK
jgi:hypothetical protein